MREAPVQSARRPSLPVCARPQALSAPLHRGGALSNKNGDPDWRIVSELVELTPELIELFGAAEEIKILEIIDALPKIKSAVEAHTHGGGGFAPGGSIGCSKLTGDLTFKLRCKSYNAFKCPASVRIIYRKATGTLHVEVAKGWAHVHSGEIHTTTGLPPSVKSLIDSVLVANPGMKCKSLKNVLWETYGVSKEQFDSQIDT